MSFALFGIAVPNFWFALLLILGFGLYLGWFPTLGYIDPSTNFGMFLWYLTLPAIVLGTDMASTVTRYVRAEMLEQLRLDYVRTARAKGVPRRRVVYKHTLRNSLIAATTVIGLQVGRLLADPRWWRQYSPGRGLAGWCWKRYTRAIIPCCRARFSFSRALTWS